MPGDQPKEIGSALDDLLGRRGLGGRQRQDDEFRRAWVEAAGPDTASHTRVRGLHRGTLMIDVDSAPLCHRLASFEHERLLLALKAALRRGDVTDIRFRLGAFS